MTNVKFIARQANADNLYKNCRSKLLKCCANIYFNKQCLLKKVIPKYAPLIRRSVSAWDPRAHDIYFKLDLD